MLVTGVFLIIILVVAQFSATHALGLWLLMMISHDFLATIFGSGVGHMPMIAGVLIAVTIIARRKWIGVPANIFLLVIALFATMFAAALAGMSSARSLVQVLLYSKGFVLAILVAGTVKSDAQVRCLTHYYLIGVLLCVCATFFEDITGIYFDDRPNITRPGWFTGNPNLTAALLLTGVPIALYWATHAKRLLEAMAYFMLIALIVGAIALTQSRGGFVSLVLISFILYLRRPSIKATVVGLAIFSALIVFAPTESGYWDRMGSVVGLGDVKGSSLDQRKYFVTAGAAITLDNPVLGVGMGNFGRAMKEADPSFRDTEDRVAHNMYLEFVTENGVFGGIFFVALLGLAVLQALRYDKRSNSDHSAYGLGFCVAMSLFAFLVSGLFGSSGKSSVLWFLVGLGFAFQEITRVARNSAVSSRAENLVGL